MGRGGKKNKELQASAAPGTRSAALHMPILDEESPFFGQPTDEELTERYEAAIRLSGLDHSKRVCECLECGYKGASQEDFVEEWGVEEFKGEVWGSGEVWGQKGSGKPCPNCGAEGDAEGGYLNDALESVYPQTGIKLQMECQASGCGFTATTDEWPIGSPCPECGEDEDFEKKSVGKFYFGPSQQRIFESVKFAMRRGGRFFLFRGPAGTGKDAIANQIAAEIGMACYRLTLAGREQTIGDLKGAVKLQSEKILDKDGKPVGIATISGTQEGNLYKAVQEPCMVVLTEPEGQQGELMNLNPTFGDDPTSGGRGRVLTIDTPGGETVAVHPDCVIVITHNDRKHQEPIPVPVTSRGASFTIEYGTVDEEASKLAQMVTNMSANSYARSDLKRTYTAEELKPMAELMMHVVNYNDSGSGTVVLDRAGVGPRDLSTMFFDVLQEYRETNGQVDPQELLARRLEPAVDYNKQGGPGSPKTVQERTEVIAKEVLNEIGPKILRQMAAIIGKNVDYNGPSPSGSEDSDQGA